MAAAPLLPHDPRRLPQDHPLFGCWEKYRRGGEHFHVLKGVLDQLWAGQFHAATFRTELKPNVKNTFRTVVADFNEPPLGLATIIGDIIHNLRSSLDHLIYELAFLGTRAGTREPMPQKNAFPCSKTKAKWNSSYVQGTLLAGVLKKHRALLYRQQPCYRRKDTGVSPPAIRRRPLNAIEDLNYLWNDDKHRMLQPVALLPFQINADIIGSTDCTPGKVRFNRRFYWRPVKVDAEVLTLPFRPTGDHPQVDVQVAIGCTVGFGNGLDVMYALTEISRVVEALLYRFEREFETPVARKLWGLPRGGWIERAPRRRLRREPPDPIPERH